MEGDLMKVSRALVCVSDLEGVTAFAMALEKYRIELLSCGGASRVFAEAQIKATSVDGYMQRSGPEPIDLLVVNFEPFDPAVKDAFDRCASHVSADAVLIVDPMDYQELLREMLQFNGCTRGSYRQKMAAKANTYAAKYDVEIASWVKARL